MLNNQSITELTLQDLESLINRIVDEKINQKVSKFWLTISPII